MAMCNIPSTNKDPSFRYKMPKLVAKIEGRGIGIKTAVINMGDVARALKCPPQYTTKWFGNELGAQSNYSFKKGEGERSLVNGSHEAPVLQTILDKFIEKYILCHNCHLPEIDMKVKKSDIVAKCRACGWAGELDGTHRIAAFIKNHPPGSFEGESAEGGGADKKKKERRPRKQPKQDGDEVASEHGSDAEDGDAKKKKKDKKKKDKKDQGEDESRDGDKKKKKKKKDKKKDKNDDEGSASDGEGEKKKKKKKKDKKDKKADSEDDSDGKTKKKDKKEKKDKKKKKESSDEEPDSENEVELLEYDDEEITKLIGDLNSFLGKGKPSVGDFFQEVRGFQVSKVFDDTVRLFLVISALAGSKLDAKQLADKEDYVAEVITKSKEGPLSGKVVLWVFDAYLSKNPESKKGFPMVLKAIYDQDWAKEADILSYYNENEGKGQPGFAEAKDVSKPFLDWLAQDNEDSSDEDSDDSESD